MKLRWLVCMLAVLSFAGCAYNQPPPQEDDMTKEGRQLDEYKIGVDDQISVNVWRDPELSVSMPVRPDGKITMPLIGDVKAGGRTPEEVAATIRKKLSAYIRNPDVTVILTELRSHEYLSRVRVTGAVEEPLSMAYRQGMTVLDAVLEAGGINVYAAPGGTKVFRREGSETRVIDVNLDNILKDGDLRTNIYLRPGDVITVPERLF